MNLPKDLRAHTSEKERNMMMKTMKKLLCAVLAIAMVLGLAANSLAVEAVTYNVSVSEEDGHTYQIYQIFTGDFSEEILSNVKWGANGTGTPGDEVDSAVLEALEALKTETDDTVKLETVLGYVDLESEPMGQVASGETLAVEGGYYLFEDIGEAAPGEGLSLYIVEVAGDVSITPKRGEVTVEKKVKDINDSTETEPGDWQDTADHDISDEVAFQLKGTVAQDYASYDSYYFAFHDDEGEGLTFKPESLKVFVDGVEITQGFAVVTEELEDGCTFEVVFEDLKTVEAVKAGSVITVEYVSVLNENAVLGSAGNPNEVFIEFSNDPNGEGTNTTEKDTVIVFTYKVTADKITADGQPLAGAGFTLYKYDAETKDYVAVGEELIGEELTTFQWTGIDDGAYRLEETTTPIGYNTVDPIEFTVTADHDIVISDEAPLNSLDGGEVLTGEVETGVLSTDVVNTPGSNLPETGGIGTYIFYTVGGLMVVGAIVFLVVRKRMGSRQQ